MSTFYQKEILLIEEIGTRCNYSNFAKQPSILYVPIVLRIINKRKERKRYLRDMTVEYTVVHRT